MVSLALDSAVLAETYDRVSDRQFNHGKLLIGDLALRRGENVLDVGCGTGRLAAYVADIVGPTGKVHGVDPLPLRVELAKRKGKPNLTAEVARAEDLSALPDGSFDAVFYNSVLHWIEDKRAALEEALRLTRPAGRVGISTAAKERPHDFERALQEVFARPEFADLSSSSSGTPYKTSSDELSGLLRDVGFRDVRLQIRTFTDHFATAEDVVTFNLASSFGNFLSHLGAKERERTKKALEAVLERSRTPEGIRLERHLIFAVARAER